MAIHADFKNSLTAIQKPSANLNHLSQTAQTFVNSLLMAGRILHKSDFGLDQISSKTLHQAVFQIPIVTCAFSFCGAPETFLSTPHQL
jgi:hypothetical protein